VNGSLGTFLYEDHRVELRTNDLDRVLDELPERIQGEVAEQVRRVGAEILDIDLSDVLLGAWCGWRTVHDEAVRSRAEPGTPRIVDLAAHKVELAQEPYVEVLVDQTQVCKVVVTVKLCFSVEGLTLVLRNARIVSLRTGDVELTATVAVADKELASRKQRYDVGAAIQLGDGIPVLATDPGEANAARRPSRGTVYRTTRT
jgi:hypothetical protein